MKLLSRTSDGNYTEYEFSLDDGRIIRVVRKHYPEWVSNSLWSTDDLDKETFYQLLGEMKTLMPFTDTIMPSIRRKTKLSYKMDRDVCYSYEQAIYLADKRWAEHPDPDYWDTLQIVIGDEVLKDYLSKN